MRINISLNTNTDTPTEITAITAENSFYAIYEDRPIDKLVDMIIDQMEERCESEHNIRLFYTAISQMVKGLR